MKAIVLMNLQVWYHAEEEKEKGKEKALPVTQGGQYLFIAKSWLMHKGDKGKAGQESSSLQSRFRDLATSWWSSFSIEKCPVRTYSLSISTSFCSLFPIESGTEALFLSCQTGL